MEQVIVKTLPKGQVTIPKRLREELGIKVNSYLRVYVKAGKLIVEPIDVSGAPTRLYVRSYSQKEVAQFLKLDQLDSKSRRKAEELLGK